jgi:hypothetical protein
MYSKASQTIHHRVKLNIRDSSFYKDCFPAAAPEQQQENQGPFGSRAIPKGLALLLLPLAFGFPLGEN